MSDSGSPEARAIDAGSMASEPPGLRSLASTSSRGSLDAEVQAAVVARRVFDGAPPDERHTIDRFEIDRVVGAGSSGTVYAARDPVLDRRVAIKLLAATGAHRPEAATERLIREARALAQLSHRNVVAIYEVGQWSDRPFIAMELIEGTTLARWLAVQRRSVAEISAAFWQAGQGLAAAHARHRVHRDFKPANVLVADDGRVVVTDFGLVDDAARDGGNGGDGGDAARGLRGRCAVGTPAYVAPEQRDGAPARPAADVYSFALALVEAVLGHHPAPEAGPRWKHALRRRVSRPVYRALCAALELDPQRRMRTLEPLLAVLAVHRGGRAQRGATAIAVMAVAATAIAWGRDRPPPPDPARASPRTPRTIPSELFDAARALVATPPERRDDGWRERARMLLMFPIPARVPCDWPAPPRAVIVAGDDAIALDLEGRVHSCAIRTGRMTTIAGEVTCLRANDGGTAIALVLRDDRIATYHRDGAAWRSIGPAAATATAPDTGRDPLCRFSVASDGAVRFDPPRAAASRATDAAVSPHGGRVLSRDPEGRLDVRELASGRRYPLADAKMQTAYFLDDDQIVAADDTGMVWRWSLGRMRSSILADHGGEAWLWGFATCDRDRAVVSATNRTDGAIAVSSPSGAPQRTLAKPPGAQIYGIACSDDRILAGTRDGRVRAWQRSTGRVIADHDLGVRTWIWAIASASPPDGSPIDFVGTGRAGDDKAAPGGRVVAIRHGELIPVFSAGPGGNTGIDDFAVSSSGELVAAVASSGQLAMIDVGHAALGPAVQAHQNEARRVRFVAGDRSVVTIGDDGYLRHWRSADLALLGEINVEHGQIFDLDVHGTTALVATSDGHVSTWDITARHRLHTYAGHSAALAAARLDASGEWIATGDFAGRVCVHRIDVERCYVELIGHQRGATIRHVRFLGDGQLITASEDGTVRQWTPPYRAPDDDLACELAGRVSGDDRACAPR